LTINNAQNLRQVDRVLNYAYCSYSGYLMDILDHSSVSLHHGMFQQFQKGEPGCWASPL